MGEGFVDAFQQQSADRYQLMSRVATVKGARTSLYLSESKRLLVAAWLRARGESVEILPALDGHGIDVVFRRTSSLTKAECGELIDFIEAWRVDQLED